LNINNSEFLKSKVFNFFNIALSLIAVIQYCLLIPTGEGKNSILVLTVDTYLDYKIKFIPEFLIFYLSLYILIIFTFIYLIRKAEKFDLSVFLFSVVLLWSIINFAHGFIFTRNGMRPEITEGGFFYNGVKSLYTIVKPYDGLPSWNASTAILCSLVFFKIDFRKKIYIYVWSSLICLSLLFLKMNYILEVILAVPLPFFCYVVSEKAMRYSFSKETIYEVSRTFTLESLIQSVAIGIRDESTLVSLIDGLTRIEKNLTAKDTEEIKQLCTMLKLKELTLKEVINNLILSINVKNNIKKAQEIFGDGDKHYSPTDAELKHALEDLTGNACLPFDKPEFRALILEIRKRNTPLINMSSIEEAAMEKSQNTINTFKCFIEAHKRNIPAIRSIINNTNGHNKIRHDDIKIISSELRKPPFEITPDEIWKAYQKIDETKVKPIGKLQNPADIISLTKYAAGKINHLEPFSENVDKRFSEWIKAKESEGKIFTEEESEWLVMIKNYIASYFEITMVNFNSPPFVNKGGANKAHSIFGTDFSGILSELNEKLI
jgi:EcoEI R protein C-terminal